MRRALFTLIVLIVATGVGAAAAPLGAQGFTRDLTELLRKELLRDAKSGSLKLPADLMPPPGMCRVWIDGVAPMQQPAPTDCATAVRNRPPNGRVVFSDDVSDGRAKKDKRDDERKDEPPKKKP